MTDSWLDAIEARPEPFTLAHALMSRPYEDAKTAVLATRAAETLRTQGNDIRHLADAVRERDAEIERLQRWKAEASEVLSGWECVWVAAGEPGELGTFKQSATAAEVERLRAALARVEALAESLVWKRPDKSPCGDAIPDCCGDEFHCDAMRPSSKVVGHRAIRAALAGEGEQ